MDLPGKNAEPTEILEHLERENTEPSPNQKAKQEALGDLRALERGRRPLRSCRAPGPGRTLPADADVEHAGAGAVAGGHAEAGVGRIHRRVGKHHGGGHEAERGHPGHSS